MPSIKESALRLVLKARDSLSRPVQKSAASLESLRTEASQLKQQLSALEKQDKLLSAFRRQTETVRNAGKVYRDAEARVEQLAREYQQAIQPAKNLQRSLESARKSVISANQAYQHQRQKLSELRHSLSQAGLSNRNLSAQQKRIQTELHKTSGAFKKVTAKAKETARNLKKPSFSQVARDADKASGSMGRLSQRLGAVVAASVGLYTLKRAFTGLLATGDQFERLRVQLNAVMGSVEGGEKAIQWIKSFTQETPYQLEQVAEAFVRLKAFGLDPMDGSMQAMVDQASKLGGGMERLNGISLAVGQAWAKQKLQGEEILQLVERGVPVWELLEKATGKNVQELQKLSTAGKLGRDTLALLIDEIGQSAQGAAAENMSLLSGYVSNLKDSWQNFVDEVAQSGALDYAKEQLKTLSDQIGAMSEDGRLTRLAQSISDGFIRMSESIRLSLSSITIEELVAKLQTGFTTISNVLGSLRTAFTLTGSTISFFFNSFTLAVKSFGLVFSSAVASIAQNAAKMFAAFGADDTASKVQAFSDSLKAIAQGFKKEAAEDVKDVQASWSSILTELGRQNASTHQDIRTETKQTVNEIKTGLRETEQAAKKTGEATKQAFADAADALKQINAAETRTELADLGVALSQAFADGTITQEQYNELLEASKQKLFELKGQAESTAESVSKVGKAGEEAGAGLASGASSAQSSLDGLAGFYNNITAELNGMSAQAEVTFKQLQGASRIDTSGTLDDLGALKLELKETVNEVHSLSNAVNIGDVTGIGTWMTDTATNAAYVKKEFLEQKVALEELVQGYEKGTISASQLASQGQAAAHTLDLLDEQDLDNLNSAIDSASDSMARLKDQSQSTLDSLQDELDRLEGRQEDIERRRFESRKQDLLTQQTEAQAKGDSNAVNNLNQALNLNEQIFNKRRQEAQQKQYQERQRERQENSRINTQPNITQTSPQKVIRLEAPGGGVNIGIAPNDEAKLLTALKNAGLRSV